MLMHVLTTLSGVFFFFQAEDGIRDLTVTGVQTCALPILVYNSAPSHRRPEPERRHAAEPESRLDGARRHGGDAAVLGATLERGASARRGVDEQSCRRHPPRRARRNTPPALHPSQTRRPRPQIPGGL